MLLKSSITRLERNIRRAFASSLDRTSHSNLSGSVLIGSCETALARLTKRILEETSVVALAEIIFVTGLLLREKILEVIKVGVASGYEGTLLI